MKEEINDIDIFNEIENVNRKELKNGDNDEDDIYYKNKDNENNTYLTIKIIKNYIDSAIIILSIENYYFEEYFVLMAKLRQVLGKEITNCLIILNKMDISADPDIDIKKCKVEIFKHFPKYQTFNLNLNTFIPLSVKKVENELLMKKSSKHLIYYHFFNSKLSQNNNHAFIDHLKYIIKIEEPEIEDIELKLEEFNNLENITEINNEIITMIKELLNEFQIINLRFCLSEEDFKNSDNNNNHKEKNKKNKKNLLKYSSNIFKYIIYIS